FGNEAFSALQVFHVGGAVTDVATVMVRYRNVVVTVTLNGLAHSNKGTYGPVSKTQLATAAMAFARSAEASPHEPRPPRTQRPAPTPAARPSTGAVRAAATALPPLPVPRRPPGPPPRVRPAPPRPAPPPQPRADPLARAVSSLQPKKPHRHQRGTDNSRHDVT